jgi:hypothetical protein
MKRNTTIVAATAMFLLAAISLNSMAAYAQNATDTTGVAA